jgi:AcrR family transcriptional regulator
MAVIGRPREFDRDAALEAAMFLFWRKGFAATSMNDLCDAMGVRSPSLYAAFGSKEALYLEAVDTSGRRGPRSGTSLRKERPPAPASRTC